MKIVEAPEPRRAQSLRRRAVQTPSCFASRC